MNYTVGKTNEAERIRIALERQRRNVEKAFDRLNGDPSAFYPEGEEWMIAQREVDQIVIKFGYYLVEGYLNSIKDRYIEPSLDPWELPSRSEFTEF